MKKHIGALLISMSALLISAQVNAGGEKGTPDEAVAMVKSAVATIKEKGKEKAFAEIADTTNAKFHDRDLYVFVYDLKGTTLAHGNNPKMVGRNLYDLKDADGKLVLQELIKISKSKGSGWLDFKWPNPVSKQLEQKSSYIETHDEMIIGSGIYK